MSLCGCGCGGSPRGKKSRFLPGHDARRHSVRARVAEAAAIPDEPPGKITWERLSHLAQGTEIIVQFQPPGEKIATVWGKFRGIEDGFGAVVDIGPHRAASVRQPEFIRAWPIKEQNT